MDINRILRINARIEVRKLTSTNFSMARVADIGEGEFAITVLYGGPTGEVLETEEKVECSLSDEEENAQFGFESTVLRREGRAVPLYFLSKPTKLVRLQRRGFVRVQVLLGADYCLDGRNEWIRAYLLDLSGGGAKLSHSEDLPPGQIITLSFKMSPDEPSLFLQGRIVRSIPVSTSVGNIYHSGVEFVDISIGVQDSIVAFVFGRLLDKRRTREGRV